MFWRIKAAYLILVSSININKRKTIAKWQHGGSEKMKNEFKKNKCQSKIIMDWQCLMVNTQMLLVFFTN